MSTTKRYYLTSTDLETLSDGEVVELMDSDGTITQLIPGDDN